MPNYGLVTEAIDRVADRVMNIYGRKMAHEETMTGYGLAEAKLGYEQKYRQGEQQLRKAKLERENWLNEQVTLREAIMGSKFSDEVKKGLIARAEKTAPEMLDGGENGLFLFSRKDWFERANRALQKQQEREATAAFRQQKIGIEREKMAATKDYREKQIGLSRDQLEALKSYRGEQIGIEREKVGVARERVRALAGKKEFDIRKEAIRRAENDPDYMRARTNEEKEPIVQRYIDLIKGETKETPAIIINQRGRGKRGNQDPLGIR